MTATIPGINGGAPTSYQNWVNGNANGQKAHWREGDFISYRTLVSDITAGTTHTLVFSYDPVSSSGHAIDYLGSFDGTETTATSTTSSQGTIIQANNNNPCSDLVAAGGMAGDCTPSDPQGSAPIPAADFAGQTGCGGAPGTFTGTQTPGSIDLFGPTGSAITGVTYLSQNVPAGGGTCTTTVQVSFTVSQDIGANQDIVLAWGGHIASSGDWGQGNGAGSISGSPFHMSLVSLDGASTGAQSASLQSSAIYFTPNLATQVVANGSPLARTITIGSTVNDTATLTGTSPTAGGTVTYSLFNTGDCTGTPSSTQQVAVTNGVVPPSASFTPAAGSFSYSASYTNGG
ncbi:MAG: hypothetical protein J2P57_16080, partial [Acidimicrobiaceae bacterium]|nr:hypothetical protein [Acidimicrobiaceae bacterium]